MEVSLEHTKQTSSALDMDTNGSSTGNVFCVTSSVPNEGKSTTAVGLAVLNAMLGSRVCIVEMDFRRPSVHEILNLEPNSGLAEHLQEHALKYHYKPSMSAILN